MSSHIPAFEASEFTICKGEQGEIGAGANSIVKLCRHGQFGWVAVKCLKNSGAKENKEETKKKMKEAELLYGKRHENIVLIHGYTTWSHCIGIVTEFCKCKDLESLMIKKQANFPNSDVVWGVRLKIIFEIMEGLNYLHDEKLVHRDLKLQNILLFDNLQAKIADFGSAHLISTITGSTSGPLKGTLPYTAPELFQPLSTRTIKPHTSQDMYSAAMMMYEIITRKTVMGDMGNINRFLAGMGIGQRPTGIKDVIKDLTENGSNLDLKLVKDLHIIVESCWHQDPTKRKTARNVREEIWEFIIQRDEADCVTRKVAEIANKLKFELSEQRWNETTLDRVSDGFQDTGDKVDSLILIGGQGTLSEVRMFNTKTKQWSNLKSLKLGRCHHSSVTLANQVFVIGGVNGSKVLKSVEYLDIEKQSEWQEAPPMQECRYQAAAEVLAEKIYVLGGKNEKDEVLDSIEVFESSSSKTCWTIVAAKLQPGRFQLTTFVFSDSIYCCGGMNGKQEGLNSVERLSLVENQLKSGEIEEGIRQMKSPMSGSCSVNVNKDEIFLLGGLNKDGKNVDKTVTCFLAKEWTSAPYSMCVNRCSFAAGVIGSTVYAVGGHGQNNATLSLSTIESIDLSEKKPEWKIFTRTKMYWAGHTVVTW